MSDGCTHTYTSRKEANRLVIFVLLLILVGLKAEIDEEEQGPNRNTADFRIKKAQVRFCM